jgi:hypothetical protein
VTARSWWTLAVAVVFSLGLIAVNRVLDGPRITLSRIEGADRVEVIGGGAVRRVVRETRNPAEIAPLVRFANERLTGWHQVRFATEPSPRALARFYRGGTYLGHVGALENELTADRAAQGFVARSADAGEVMALLKLLGVARDSLWTSPAEPGARDDRPRPPESP